MGETTSHESLSDQVYASLLNLVWRRSLVGNQTFSPASQARSLGVSRMPVSLALEKLPRFDHRLRIEHFCLPQRDQAGCAGRRAAPIHQ